jgi:hypothetical protein
VLLICLTQDFLVEFLSYQGFASFLESKVFGSGEDPEIQYFDESVEKVSSLVPFYKSLHVLLTRSHSLHGPLHHTSLQATKRYRSPSNVKGLMRSNSFAVKPLSTDELIPPTPPPVECVIPPLPDLSAVEEKEQDIEDTDAELDAFSSEPGICY